MDERKDGGATPAAGVAAARGGRGVRIALGVSVALNLLVVGLVAGAVLRDGGPRERMVRDLDFGPFTEALSREDRAALRRAFLQRSPGMQDMRQQMRQDFRALLAALRAEPFDPDALRGVLVNQQARMAERVSLGQELMLERLSVMAPQERAAFADRLEQRLRHGAREGHGGRDGHGGPAD